jgi:LysR family transcriptional regulator (chromosome initiation inhibitor)
MLRSPAVIFNRKDGLQDLFLKNHFQITHAPYPRHFVPAVDGFECAITEGLGWGMVPEIALKTRLNPDQCEVIFPALWVDVPLVWQHWTRASNPTNALTKIIQKAAATHLRGPLFTP